MTVQIIGAPYDGIRIGATVTLDDATEAALITIGRAVRVTTQAVPTAIPVAMLRPASYFGVYAGTQDMTVQMTTACNAALNEGWEIQLPYGDVNISGTINVTAPQAQLVSTYLGNANWARPVGLRGFDPLKSRIVQNSANTLSMYYFPTSGNMARGRFTDFSFVAATPSYTNVNNAGIQIGGGTTNCVSDEFEFTNVGGDGLYCVVRLDDCTGVTFSGNFEGMRFKYYSESGYNADKHTFRRFYHSTDNPINIAYSGVSGSQLTGVSASVTPFVYVGMGATGPNIPADTTVTAVGSTTVTLSNAPSAGASTVDFHLGIICSLLLSNNGGLYSGSGFATVLNNLGAFNRNRSSNPNVVIFNDMVVNRAQRMLEDYAATYCCSMRGIYMERPQNFANFTGTGLQALDIDGIFFSQPSTMRQPIINITAATPQGRIANMRTDGTPVTTTAVNAPNIISSSEFGSFIVENMPSPAVNVITGGGPTLSALARKITLGTKESGTGTLEYDTAAGDLNFDALGVDTVRVLVNTTGRTINGPNSVQVPEDRNITFLFMSNNAGATIALATKYKKSDGTNWGAITIGAVGTRASLTFRSLGNGNYQSQAAGTLVFV